MRNLKRNAVVNKVLQFSYCSLMMCFVVSAAAMSLFPEIKKADVNKVISNHINTMRCRLKAKGKLAKLEEKGRAALKTMAFTQDTDVSSSDDSD